ncbi:MAG: hypothetical protein WC477_06265 [Patescibacteria group bacterium]
MLKTLHRVAFGVLSLWAVVSCFIIFRGSAELDGLRVRAEQITSDLGKAKSDLATARTQVGVLVEELASANGRIGQLEGRVSGYQKQIADILGSIGSARGDAQEVGRLADELGTIVQGIQRRGGDKNKAP